MTGFWEQLPGGPLARAPLNVRGRLISRTPGDNYEDVTISAYGPSFVATDYLPLPAALSVAQTSRTVAVLDWAPGPEGFPRAHVATWEVYRGVDGAEPVLITTLDDDVLSYTDSPLPTNTPEHIFAYVVYGVSADGRRNSNTVAVQWSGTILNQPTAPTGFAFSNLTATSVRFTWSETPDGTVTKHGLFQGSVLLVNDIPASATSYIWSGRTASTTYSNISVRRYNAWMGGTVPGWSPASNAVTFTTPAVSAGPLFLGDVPGQIYLGWTMNASNAAELSYENQLNTQVPFTALAPSGTNYANLLGARRLFSKNTAHINHADANNRLLWISAKGPEFGAGNSGPAGWGEVASGTHDAGIVSYFTSLVARNKLTIFTFHHEPTGDASATADGTAHANAHKRIKQVVNSNFPGHRILFCPNYEENRIRNPQAFMDWQRWFPQEMMPGQNSYSWDFISYDTYQYGANTSTNPTQGVQFSHRYFRLVDILSGDYTPPGTTPMPYMNYTPGQDIRIGFGEIGHWPYWFYAWENNLGGSMSNMTGAKYTRDMMDFMWQHIDEIFVACWFNTIGSSNVTGDTRLWPSNTGFPGDGQQPNHPSFVQQTGDTEYAINVFREKLATGLTVKLASNGLPPA